ncbi:MAG: hypothetical protein ACE5WD_08325 [Candidatus Aminicenantia bacterium]
MEGRKELLKLGITVFLVVLTFSYLAGESYLRQRNEDKIARLRTEIHLINLINGLDLTPEQMKIIRDNAEEKIRVQESLKEEIQSKEREITIILEEIRSYLKDNREIPQPLKQEFHRLQTEIKRLIFNSNEKIKDLALAVEQSLKNHQKYQLKNFVPCIIPPQGELRIGQASDLKGPIRQLERLREIPDRIYQRRKEMIVQRMIERMKFHFPPLKEIDEGEIKAHLLSVVEEIRSLPETDFQLQKEALAEKLISPFKPNHKDENITKKIKMFLLSPEIIPLLEERMGSLQ